LKKKSLLPTRTRSAYVPSAEKVLRLSKIRFVPAVRNVMKFSKTKLNLP